MKIAPPEEVLERRRHHRMRVNASIDTSNGTKRLLWENIVMLLILGGSVYGIFRLCLYLFQTTL